MSKKKKRSHFIEQIVEDDLASGRIKSLRLRFPPEPNGHLHLGHVKSLYLNYGLAERYGGGCHLRFDDTNPLKENVSYADAIIRDIEWLGYSTQAHTYASDYFDKMYACACSLIRQGSAYVDDHSASAFASLFKGSPTEAGKESPYRGRSVAENLSLFEAMRAGKYPNESRTLRAKIRMDDPNMHMRDPIIYRIKHTSHWRSKDAWCIYPMYDYAHPLADAFEGITHSLCTLEFEVHRPLYEWFLEQLPDLAAPRQIEFARLNLAYHVLSKRKTDQMIQKGWVSGWTDPRVPSLSGLRRRGYTPTALKAFVERTGLSKRNTLSEPALLEWAARKELNTKAIRRLAVLDPILLTIHNFPKDKVEWLEALNNPEDASAGMRKIPFSRSLYIDASDFCMDPPADYFRLAPKAEVRLKYAYIIRCESYVRDPKTSRIKEIICSYDASTRSGTPGARRKVKGTLSWVSAAEALVCEVRLYQPLFTCRDPSNEPDWAQYHYQNSIQRRSKARIEPAIADAKPGEVFQFERIGYFCADQTDAHKNRLFHESLPLKESFSFSAKDVSHKTSSMPS